MDSKLEQIPPIQTPVACESSQGLLQEDSPPIPGPFWNRPWLSPTLKALGIAAGLGVLAWMGAHSAGATLVPSSPPVQAPAVAVSASASAQTAAAPASSSGGAPTTVESAVVGVLPDGRVILNAASEQDLCKLPSIGPSRAKSILALRKQLGRFRSVRELLRVKGIGPKTLVRLTPLIVLDAPSSGGAGGGAAAAPSAG